MNFASAGGFAMPCAPARPRVNLVPFMSVLTAAAFVQPWPCQRDPVIFRSPPLPLPDALKALPAFLTDPMGATHMRVTVQLWDDGGHRVSHELGDGALRWHADTPPTKFATVGEMLAAIVFQPEHRRRVWAGEDDRSTAPDLAAELAA